MSYLDLPRFHLLGRFYANPPTINNQAINYDPATALVLASRSVPGSVSWDPPGIGVFKMSGTVQTVLGADGGAVPATDGLVGATLASSDAPVAAKLVNLDPQQQNTSAVYGMQLSLTLPGAAEPAFSGTVAPAQLADIWGRTVTGVGIEYASGMYQSVIQVAWGDVSASPVLAALKDRTADGLLSIRWVVDGFDAQHDSPTFGWGRMVATVGPYLQGEPCHFLAQRRLLAVSPPVPQPPEAPLGKYAAGLWYAPFQVGPAVGGSAATLVLDLGNAVATLDRYGAGATLFDEIQVNLDAYGANTVLGCVPFSQQVYEQCAGVVVLPLDTGQLATVQSTAVAITGLPAPGPVTQLQSDGFTTEVLTPSSTLRERQDGALAVLEPAFLRLDPGTPQAAVLWAREFGAPASRTVDLILSQTANSDSSAGVELKDGGTVPVWVGSTDTAQLTLSTPSGPIAWNGDTALVPVDGGTASLTLTCTGKVSGAKSRWREQVDGEVYFLTSSLWPELLTYWAAVPLMSILAFDVFTPGDPPTWYGDVQPILAQYARLYPGMRSILDISDLGTLQQQFFNTGRTGAQLVAQALSLGIGDPDHMPVTRDLSAARRKAILDWIGNGCKDLGTQPPPAPAPEPVLPADPSAHLASAAQIISV